MAAPVKSGEPAQSHEHGVSGAVCQASALNADEEARRRRIGTQLVAASRIGSESAGGGRVNGHVPRPAVLPEPDEDTALGEVHVGAVEPGGLPKPESSAGKQADQRLVGGRLQWRAERPGRPHQRGDLGGTVNVGRRPLIPCGQEIGGRNLSSRVDRGHVLGEAAGHRQALALADGATGGAGSGPRQREVGRDDGGAHRVEPLAEVTEGGVVAGELVAERAADGQVLLDPRPKRAHAVAPGHGCARLTRARRSTLAYRTVAWTVWWRRSCAISISGAP